MVRQLTQHKLVTAFGIMTSVALAIAWKTTQRGTAEQRKQLRSLNAQRDEFQEAVLKYDHRQDWLELYRIRREIGALLLDMKLGRTKSTNPKLLLLAGEDGSPPKLQKPRYGVQQAS